MHGEDVTSALVLFLCVILVAAMSLLAGRDSAFGISTRYGLDGPGIESRWGRVHPHPSRPALGPIQPPIHWIQGLSRG